MHQPREDCERACDPHEKKDGDANFCPNVEFRHASYCVTEDDEHYGCDDGGGGDNERVEEGENGNGKGEPARKDGDGHGENEDEGEACACEEETEHPSRDVVNQAEDIVDVGREIDCAVLLVHV